MSRHIIDSNGTPHRLQLWQAAGAKGEWGADVVRAGGASVIAIHNAHRERRRHAWRACCAGTAVVERAGGAVSRHVRQAPRAASMAREAQTDHR